MYRTPRALIACVVAAAIAFSSPLAARQAVGPEIWRTFAEKLDPGTTLKVRLRNGQRFKATLLQVSPDALTLQPKTRAAVPPQQVPLEQIETLEVDHGKGVSLAKAVAVGAGVAAGAWLALMAIAFSVWGD